MRSRVEWALRTVALASLLLLLWRMVTPAPPPVAVATTRSGLERALVDATRRPVAALSVELDTTPGRAERDWLGAIRAAGTTIRWSGDLTPVAIAASAVAEPESRIHVAVAGADGASAVISDELGVIDTIQVRANGSSRLLRTATGSLSAFAPGSRAVVSLPARATVRRILVIGSAGWESKFAVAALEEAGWNVDARIHVAPVVEIRQGPDFPLDTARYSAVVALGGAAAANANAIARFVDAGGGAVLAGAVTRLPEFARITPGIAGTRRIAEPRSGLVLGGLKGDAVVLEGQPAQPLIAARRSGAGRVVASGYDDTWRWRMRGAAEGLMDHRDWWTALVSAVAYAPVSAARHAASFADPAPVAALTAVIGPPSVLEENPRTTQGSGTWMPPAWLLFGVVLASMLGEVVSRRWRGLA